MLFAEFRSTACQHGTFVRSLATPCPHCTPTVEAVRRRSVGRGGE
ncbi:hypothetical protein E2C01_021512 [Portunus trituberculatus]|uniref:Uncharacterized protein n=1 Tax=Portunus trituberculatus TaxID=210409 RepID=A0A5B7E2T2_PORTR|nr:hypothetical protein [Portunus trituberculatus]